MSYTAHKKALLVAMQNFEVLAHKSGVEILLGYKEVDADMFMINFTIDGTHAMAWSYENDEVLNVEVAGFSVMELGPATMFNIIDYYSKV